MGDHEKQGRGPKGRFAPQTYGSKVEKVGPAELGKAEARVTHAERIAEMLRKADAEYRKTPGYKKALAEFLEEERNLTPKVNLSEVGGSRRTRRRRRGKKVTGRRRRYQ